MASRRVDAVLLTDSNALLCGILTDKVEDDASLLYMLVSTSLGITDFSPCDLFCLFKSGHYNSGKFRHLPVVENGEVVALLDIAKCLYDAIARMERAAEKGKAIAAAVEGVEKHWGTAVSGPNNFIETLREQMFRPSLSTIISENSKVVTVAPTDTVLTASKKMLELKVSSAVVAIENKPGGILTSKDILMRVIAQNHPPESTTVEKIVSYPDGNVVTVVDVLQITHAAIATVGSSGGSGTEASSAMMQRFWDSAMSIGPLDDDDDSRSEESTKVASETTDIGRSAFYPASGLSNTFGFKIQDKQGRMHRFNCDTSSLTDLITSILQRVGDDIDRKNLPQILYEDEDHDKVILSSDSDLIAAVDHARQIGWKSLRLHLDYAGVGRRKRGGSGSSDFEYARKDAWASAYSTVAAGAALVAGLGVMAYLRRA
ncbi:hypothetical protein PR202_ga08458 [Eleusine coracana subsp. coracana]|uniref:Uncharacterized protein n=1 Tax=Eleusine coracana subsp. coracana TaxID=191504 RepID=A0AAV5C0N7_ELECO|nr:hypothetical protein PR202_ga08458 [Eleusine coracana subsp. coracana]